MLRKLFYHLTSGRPMTLIQSKILYDHVNQFWVHLWKDAFDRKWMARKAWSLFRVADVDEDAVMKQIIKDLEN